MEAIGVKATKIAFDTSEYAKDNFGNKIRKALQEHTSVVTFPQLVRARGMAASYPSPDG